MKDNFYSFAAHISSGYGTRSINDRCVFWIHFYSLVRVQRKVALGSNLLSYFTSRSWEFDNRSTLQLKNTMNAADQALFPVTASVIETHDRELFVAHSLIFARTFLMKEDPNNVPKCVRILKM